MNLRHRTRAGCGIGLVLAIYSNKDGIITRREITVTFEDRFKRWGTSKALSRKNRFSG
jgi:hypothetical protein